MTVAVRVPLRAFFMETEHRVPEITVVIFGPLEMISRKINVHPTLELRASV